MLASQRKAWNEAMRSAAGGVGVSLHPQGLYSGGTRRSDRRNTRAKQARRDRARKSADPNESSLEQREYRSAAHVDALEDVASADVLDPDADEEEYDEADEMESAGVGSKRRGGRAGSRSSKRSKKGGGGGRPGELPKHLRPRTLASILVEDAGRADGTTRKYLDAEARPTTTAGSSGRGRKRPRKFCPVTGLVGIYTDPKSGVPYATLTALEQIRERAPPWMSLGGSTAYLEAVKSLRNEDV